MRRKNDLPKLGKAIKELAVFFERLPDVMGTAYLGFVLDNFQNQAWEGKPWQPRKTNINQKDKKKKKSRALLIKTGRLRRSIRYRVERQSGRRVVIISTDVPYAQAHNEGLFIKIKTKVRSHTRYRGKVKVKAHVREQQLRLPERRFIGPSKSFNRQMQTYISQGLKRLL